MRARGCALASATFSTSTLLSVQLLEGHVEGVMADVSRQVLLKGLNWLSDAPFVSLKAEVPSIVDLEAQLGRFCMNCCHSHSMS